MVDLHILPDTETLAIAYLKTVPEVTAIVGSSVVSKRPPKAVYPMLEVAVRIGGIPPIEWRLGADILQVDAWGKTRSQARRLIYVAHAALIAWNGSQPNGEVVANTVTFAGPQALADPNLSHWLCRVRCFIHP